MEAGIGRAGAESRDRDVSTGRHQSPVPGICCVRSVCEQAAPTPVGSTSIGLGPGPTQGGNDFGNDTVTRVSAESPWALGAELRERIGAIELRGLVLLSGLTLEAEITPHGVYLLVFAHPPNAEAAERPQQIRVAMRVHVERGVDIDRLIRLAITQFWEHELLEGTRLKDGGFLIRDPHPRGVHNAQ